MLLLLTLYLFSILGIIMFRDNDPLNFLNLHVAMFTLMRCATMEDWTDVMYINMFGCQEYPYDEFNELCTDSQGQFWTAAIFFIFYIIVAALIMLTLVVGVITTSMEEAMAEMKDALRIKELVIQTKENYVISEKQMASFRQAFDLIDIDKGGTVSISELNVVVTMFNDSGTRKSESHEDLLRRWDINGDGEVDFSEFLLVLVETLKIPKRDKSKQGFSSSIMNLSTNILNGVGSITDRVLEAGDTKELRKEASFSSLDQVEEGKVVEPENPTIEPSRDRVDTDGRDIENGPAKLVVTIGSLGHISTKKPEAIPDSPNSSTKVVPM
jgi:Ca2+-binding EF-hand superfamily protein